MAHVKSPEERGPIGAWAYEARVERELSVEQVIEALPTRYHPATLRKVESGSAQPGRRMLRELAAYYGGEPPGVPLESPTAPDKLVEAIQAQTAAIRELVAELRLSRAEDLVSREALMTALGAALSREGRLEADGHDRTADARP